jgi:hypothetical protein
MKMAVWKTEINDRGGSASLTTRHPSIRKSCHYISPISGGRSVGIFRLRTKGHEVCLSNENGKTWSWLNLRHSSIHLQEGTDENHTNDQVTLTEMSIQDVSDSNEEC